MELTRERLADPAQAFNEYDQALFYDGNNPLYYADAANAALVLEKMGQAKDYAERGIRLYPNFAVIRAHLGYIAFVENRYQDAVGFFSKALETDWYEDDKGRSLTLQLLKDARLKLQRKAENDSTLPRMCGNSAVPGIGLEEK